MKSKVENSEEIKKKLLEMRNEILKDVNNNSDFSKTMGSDGVQDLGDVSANTYNRQILLSLNDNQRIMLTDIDDALDRMREDRYGLCIECEEEIDVKRLEVRPQAKYCVDCKTDIEKSDSLSGN